VNEINGPKALGLPPPGKSPAAKLSAPVRAVTASAPMLAANVVLSAPGAKLEALRTIS